MSCQGRLVIDALEVCDQSQLVSPLEATKASQALGRELPRSYWAHALSCRSREFRKRFFTKTNTSGGEDLVVEVTELLGIGGPDGVDGEFGSDYLSQEGGYPCVGVVVCMTSASGPECVMLDYQDLDARGEPAVVLVDVDRLPQVQRLAASFNEFLEGLSSALRQRPAGGLSR
jgi:hypothetical protein